MTKKELEIRKQERLNMADSIYNLVSGLYQEETDIYNNYMAKNPDDNQRIGEHLLIIDIYFKILHAIIDIKEDLNNGSYI